MKYAGFWRRFVAFLIDAAIINVIFWSFILIFGTPISQYDVATSVYYTYYDYTPFWDLFSIVGAWLYAAFMESSKYQGSLGKMALGIKVTDLDGKPISFWRATGRHFSKIISSMILGFGFLMIGWTKRKQGLHDKLVDCLVIKK